MVGKDVKRVAGFAEDHGITFVDCPAIGTRETAKQCRLVLLASGPSDALDRAQPVFDAIGSKTVRLRGRRGEPHEDCGDRLDRGARGDSSLPAKPRSALGVLAQERLPITMGTGDPQGGHDFARRAICRPGSGTRSRYSSMWLAMNART